jgi:histidyl-tRNA synthetase
LIDRRSNMDDAKWRAAAAEMGLKEQQIGNLVRILGDRDLWKKSPELGRLFATLRTLGVEEYIQYDPNIVRGLLYYTGTVFEAYDLSGSVKRAILGGGRYDNLLSDLGGAPLPGVGFAMGDVVVGILLQEGGLLPEFMPSPAPVLVTVFDETMLPKCLTVAADLRKSGVNVMVYPEIAKLQKQFKFADRMKVRLVLTIGPDEAARGEVAIKDLVEGQQISVPESEVGARIRQILER